MDFSKLIQDDLTATWVKDIIQQLSPYPYLADLLVILSSFAGGALLSLLLFFLLRRLLHRFYSRHCEMNAELQTCIRRMIVPFVGCLPMLCVSYSVWCDRARRMTTIPSRGLQIRTAIHSCIPSHHTL